MRDEPFLICVKKFMNSDVDARFEILGLKMSSGGTSGFGTRFCESRKQGGASYCALKFW